MAQHLENLHPRMYIPIFSLSLFFPSIHLPYFFVLSRPLALPLPAVCSCCYWSSHQSFLPLPKHHSLGSYHQPSGARCWLSRGAPTPAGCDCLSLPPLLFLLLSCLLLCDLNCFWISPEGRGRVQLSAWERNSLPGITHPRASQGNQRFNGRDGESMNNTCSWHWSRSASYLLILIHQFPHKLPIAPVYFLFLPLCIQIVISICPLPLLPPCNVSSNVPQELIPVAL